MIRSRIFRSLIVAVLVGAFVQMGAAQAGGSGKKKNEARPGTAAPNNDDFASASEVDALPFEQFLDNSAASTELGEPQDCGAPTNTVWFAFTPSSDVDLVARAVSEEFNTALTVYVGDSLGSLQQIGCSGGTSPTSEVGFYGFADQTYYFQVAGSDGAAGTIGFRLLRGESPGLILGKPGKLPHGWQEKVLLDPTTAEYQSEGTNLITFHGRPNPTDPKMYDIDISVGGQALPQVTLFTDGRLRDEHRYSALGPSHTYVRVGMRVRYDTRGQQCVLGIGGECRLLLPNLPGTDDITNGRAYRAELIVDVTAERKAGIAAIPLIEQTVRVPLVGYLAALLP